MSVGDLPLGVAVEQVAPVCCLEREGLGVPEAACATKSCSLKREIDEGDEHRH